MMRKFRAVPLFSIFLGIVGVAALRAEHAHVARADDVPATSVARNPTVGYRHWTRVNAMPHRISSALSMLCIGPTPEMVAKEASNPHLDQSLKAPLDKAKFVVVYANPVAQDAMLHQKRPEFPEGSVLVKEKLARAHSVEPEMLTAMVKRPKGFSPGNGDWEYYVLDGAGTKVLADGKLKACESCHADYKSNDYVARTYLSPDALTHLR